MSKEIPLPSPSEVEIESAVAAAVAKAKARRDSSAVHAVNNDVIKQELIASVRQLANVAEMFYRSVPTREHSLACQRLLQALEHLTGEEVQPSKG